MSAHFSREDVKAKHLVNMGSEDEWGAKFDAHEILNQKLAINFCLKQPTRILFLDPIFYAHNISIDLLLKQKLPPGVCPLPQNLDLAILSRWIMSHYENNLEGDYLQNIISHYPGYIYWKDQSSVYLGCNDQFAKAAGYNSGEEIIGKTDFELPWGQTEAEIYRKGDLEAFAGKAIINFEEPQMQSNGRQITVLASKVPFHDSDGNTIGVLGIYTDITQRKQEEEKLREAKEHAEAANQAKTNFLATVSHELRTPMNSIMGMAQILESKNLTQDQLEYVGTILSSSKNLLALINDILDFSKLEAGKLEINSEPFDLYQLIEEIKAGMSHLIEDKGIKLIVNYESDVTHNNILGDPLRIRQVIVNLIGNAIKFTNKGHIKVDIKCKY